MTKALAESGTPAVSVAIVRDGKVVFTKAYGDARLDPKTPTSETMRFAIGSVSKQFLAAALLLAQENRKLSLDDKVAKYEPGLTRAGEITIRQLLSHTSGYQDYYPQDYLPPFMREPSPRKELSTAGPRSRSISNPAPPGNTATPGSWWRAGYWKKQPERLRSNTFAAAFSRLCG